MMISRNVLMGSVPAAGTIRAGRFVTRAGLEVTTRGGGAFGIARDARVAGETVDVHELGDCTAVAGAAFATGAFLMSDVEGRSIAWDGSGPILAIAIEAASGADQLVQVYLWKGPADPFVEVVTSAGVIVVGHAVSFANAQVSVAGDGIKGVALTAAAGAGSPVVIRRGGPVNVVAGGAYAVGAGLAVNNVGRFVDFTDPNTQIMVAVADEAASANGQTKRAFLK